MKFMTKNTFLFLILTICFSGLTACNSSVNSAKQTGDSNAAANNSTAKTGNQDSTSEKPKSDFPLIPSALAKIEIKKIDDSTFKLEDKKGSVVLLNLWATWCGPCRGEMPHLIEMEDAFKSKNFEVVGLNTDDESVEDINRFASEMKLNYQMAYADGAMMKEFLSIGRFQGIPQSYLIDRENRLRGVFLGGGPKVIREMKATVEKVVNE